MAATTDIDWTDATPNPLTHRCTKVAPECDNCYAETLTNRWHGRGAFTSEPPRLKPGKLLEPWCNKGMREAYRKFLASMSDPFHGRLDFDDQALMFAMMAADRFSVYQVLSKRAGIMCSRLNSPRFERRVRVKLCTLERMARDARRITPWRRAMLDDIDAVRGNWAWPLPNVWVGVSAGTQRTADRLIPKLAETPAATRFLSCEPLLEHVDLTEWIAAERDVTDPDIDAPEDAVVDRIPRHGDQWIRVEHMIHWVIAGGESGPRHRPLDLDWARSLRDQCRNNWVPFWFKQVGGITHNAGGDLLDGRQWKQLPEPRPGVLV
jgi:protein gp37